MKKKKKEKVVFVTNQVPYYRISLFNELAKRINIKFVFTHEKEKIKQNGSIKEALFRKWGFKYSKWFKALILYIRHPFLYGKHFFKAFLRGKQEYRRKE